MFLLLSPLPLPLLLLLLLPLPPVSLPASSSTCPFLGPEFLLDTSEPDVPDGACPCYCATRRAAPTPKRAPPETDRATGQQRGEPRRTIKAAPCPPPLGLLLVAHRHACFFEGLFQHVRGSRATHMALAFYQSHPALVLIPNDTANFWELFFLASATTAAAVAIFGALCTFLKVDGLLSRCTTSPSTGSIQDARTVLARPGACAAAG